MPKHFAFARISLSLLLFLHVSISPASAGWGDTDKINKWFDDQKGKTYNIQTPGKIQTPGNIQVPSGNWQKPGEIQVPKGIQAIKTSQSKCLHRFTIGSDTLFAFDKYDLSPQASETLQALGPLLEKEGRHPITIEGHTDSIGSLTYNQTLSEKRANAVYEWLSALKYLSGPAVVRGYGKTRPIAANTNKDGSDNPQGRQRNRRVEIVVDTCKSIDESKKESETGPSNHVTTPVEASDRQPVKATAPANATDGSGTENAPAANAPSNGNDASQSKSPSDSPSPPGQNEAPAEKP